MTCPTSVPTIQFKGCDSNIAIRTTDGYETRTKKVMQGFGGKQIATERESVKLSISFFEKYWLEQYMKWFETEIANGTKPFAVYTEHKGKLRWWVVKYQTPQSVANMDGFVRKTSDMVTVLGWAGSVTDIVPSGYVVTDDGSKRVTDDGLYIRTDIQVGTATNITCI